MMEEKARSCKIPFPAHRSHGTGSPCNEAAKKITTGGQQPATQQEERNASSGDLEAEYEGEGDRGYDGGGYDDRLRVDGPEQVAAVAVGCRGEGPRQRQRSYWGRERDWRCASLVPHGGERRSGRGGAATEGSGAAGGGGGAEKGSHGMGEELEDVTVTWQR